MHSTVRTSGRARRGARRADALGAVADRLPMQGAFGTAVAGLIVCAVAREHGVRDPADWVPLLGRVLFDRELGRPQAAQVVPPTRRAQAPDAGPLRKLGGALWR